MGRESAIKTKGPQRAGRPSRYSPSTAETICERIAAGEPLTRICKDDDMPAYRTVLGWRVSNEQFQHMYARAREDAADTLADEIRELARRVEKGELEPNAGRVAIDALKWSASKLKPREYGDRSRVDMSAKLETKLRPSDYMPEWMKERLDKESRAISKEGEAPKLGNSRSVSA